MFKVKVPATTANMGPGYDSFGMALTLYNEFLVEFTEEPIKMEGFSDIPLEDNLVYTTMKKTLDVCGNQKDHVKVVAKDIAIPMSRGLGSSATCIAAGMMIANEMMKRPLKKEDMILLGTSMEGHPDNIVPALVGGMNVSICEASKVHYSKINVHKDLRFAVMIPNFSVATQDARRVVPDRFSKEDCIFNLSRAAMMIKSLESGAFHHLRMTMQDRLHQPYRKDLIHGINKVFEYAQKEGSFAEVISGSGSTLLAVIHKDHTDFKEKMDHHLKNMDHHWSIKILDMDQEGTKVL